MDQGPSWQWQNQPSGQPPQQPPQPGAPFPAPPPPPEAPLPGSTGPLGPAPAPPADPGPPPGASPPPGGGGGGYGGYGGPSGEWSAPGPSGGRSGPPTLIIGIGVLVVVALAAAALFVLFSDDDTETAGGGDTTEDDQSETTDTTTPGDPNEQVPPEDGVQLDPARLNGQWEGTYECTRGPTDLTLWLDDWTDGHVSGSFKFEPAEGNSEVEPGLFFVEGTYESGSLSLDDIRWAESQHPDGYQSVGLSATVDPADTESMEVELDAAECEPFTLERVSMQPWYVGTFTGFYECTQGITGMTLSIEATGDGQAKAFLEFYEIEQSTESIPTGSYYVDGIYGFNNSEDPRPTLFFSAGTANWHEQPQNYQATDMYSYAREFMNPYEYSGLFDTEGCTVFVLERISEEPSHTPEDGWENGRPTED